MSGDFDDWGPFDEDDPDGEGFDDFVEIPVVARPQFLDDGAPIPDHGRVSIPAVLALPGTSIGYQLNNAEVISPLASAEAVWRGRNYPPSDVRDQAHNRLYVDEATGEIEVNRNGVVRIDTLAVNDDDEDLAELRPGLANLTIQAFDEIDRVWALEVQMPAARRAAIAQEIADIAKRGGLVTIQPELFERNQAVMDGFIAIDPQAVSAIAISPDDDGGWLMELKRGKGDGVIIAFSSGTKAIDAMVYTIGELKRDIDYASITPHDDAGRPGPATLIGAKEAGQAATAMTSPPPRPEIAVMLCDPPRNTQAANDALPKEVSGVGLNPKWLGRMARFDDRISAIAKLADAVIYPNGR
ncbi:MAG: hypothetical protein AAF556_10225, partial [Pseudomonadota bacterium]